MVGAIAEAGEDGAFDASDSSKGQIRRDSRFGENQKVLVRVGMCREERGRRVEGGVISEDVEDTGGKAGLRTVL